MKKLVALILSIALVVTMCSCALAVNEGGVDAAGTDAVHVTALKKSLELTDTTTAIALYAPEITYQYALNTTALTAAELGYDTTTGDASALNDDYRTHDDTISGAGITVRDGYTWSTTGGPTVAIASPGTISFTNADILAAANNTGDDGDNLIVKSLGITTTAGTVPGIYRFKVSESIATGSKTRAVAGITQSNPYIADRYLDVYVTYNASDELVISNVVLFRYADSNATKTEGWTSANDLDTYETVDVTVTKHITGNLADKNHEFPFSFNVSDPNTGSLYSYMDDNHEIVAGAAFGTSVNTAYGDAVALKDGASFVIYGLPKNATGSSTVTVSEENNTVDMYTYQTSGFDADKTTDTSFDDTTNASDSLVKANIQDDVDDLEFTNKLENISPTGVILRVAPYAMILCAGILLLMLGRKMKKATEN